MCHRLDDGASSSDTSRIDKGGGQNCCDVCTGKVHAARPATPTTRKIDQTNMAKDPVWRWSQKKMKSTMSLCVSLCISLCLIASAIELTPENWEAETSGKTVFIKMFAPWVSAVFSIPLFGFWLMFFAVWALQENKTDVGQAYDRVRRFRHVVDCRYRLH